MKKEEPQVNSIQEFLTLITNWYQDDTYGFRTMYLNAVKNVNTYPSGTSESVKYDWNKPEGEALENLCSFFKQWYLWNPDLSTGLEFIQKFSWLYYENPAGLEFVSGYPNPDNPGYIMTMLYVALNGQKMDSSESLPLVDKWIKALGPAMDEYIIPDGGFKSFNEFFARELKYGERPISGVNDNSVVVAPADAIINMIDDNLSIEKAIDVKTQKLNVLQLLNNSPLASSFEGGSAISCILMPTVYHRYHSPVSGIVVEAADDVAGNYFGIKDFPELINGGNVGYGYDYSVFEHFRRGYLIIETEKYGNVAMIPVGLNTISSVIFSPKFKKIDFSNPTPINKGEEVGYFQYGGSLNILLFEKGCFPSVRIPQGQIIGTMEEKGSKIQMSF